MTKLEQALNAIKDRSSLLWMFYHPEDVFASQIVEVRLNGRCDQIDTFKPPKGWSLHRVQWGDTFFIRREQLMSEVRIEAMLSAMLHFANKHHMRVHS